MFTFLKKFLNLFKSKDVQAEVVTSEVPALPYDDNLKNPCVHMLAIVDVAGQITGYLPLAAEDNSDGIATTKVTNEKEN